MPCQGIVHYKRDYINTRQQMAYYDNLTIFRPSAINWLRNAWGNVDRVGRHVYDSMQRVTSLILPYSRLIRSKRHRTSEEVTHELIRSDELYDNFERTRETTYI